MYLSFIWLSVDLRMNTQKTWNLKEVGLCVQNMLTILDSVFNMNRGGGGTYMTT